MNKPLLLFVLYPAIVLAQSPSTKDIHLPKVKQQSHSQLSHVQSHSSRRCCSKPPKNTACGGAVNPCSQLKRLHNSYLRSVEGLANENLFSTLFPSDRSLDAAESMTFAYGPQNPDAALVNIGGRIFASQTVEETHDISGMETAEREAIKSGLAQSTASTSQPSVTGYSPLFGNPGTVLTITGSNFGAASSNSYVFVVSAETNSISVWPTSSWSDTRIVLTVPSAMPLGKVYLNVLANGVNSTGTYPFTVGIPPSIISYSPPSGLPGTVITINGSRFGSSQGSGFVSVLSAVTNTWTTWPTTAWSDTEITVPVPASMPLGKVYLSVTAGGLATIGTYPFTVGVPPVIECYSPLYGALGASVTINGSGFGLNQGNSFVSVLSAVTNIWTTWTPSSWSDTQIVISVPENMPLGKVYLNVTVGGLQSIGTYPFTVGIPPFITSYSPPYGNPGTVLTIDGAGFGSTQGSNYVSVLSAVTNTWTTWPVINWGDTQITATIPSAMRLGKVYLSVTADGLASIGTYPFTVGIPPFIMSYSPTSGPAGTIITIQGSGFGLTQGSSFVTLQSITNTITPLTVVSWSQNQIVVSVPNLTPTCLNYLSVTVAGLQTIGTYPFSVK